MTATHTHTHTRRDTSSLKLLSFGIFIFSPVSFCRRIRIKRKKRTKNTTYYFFRHFVSLVTFFPIKSVPFNDFTSTALCVRVYESFKRSIQGGGFLSAGGHTPNTVPFDDENESFSVFINGHCPPNKCSAEEDGEHGEDGDEWKKRPLHMTASRKCKCQIYVLIRADEIKSNNRKWIGQNEWMSFVDLSNYFLIYHTPNDAKEKKMAIFRSFQFRWYGNAMNVERQCMSVNGFIDCTDWKWTFHKNKKCPTRPYRAALFSQCPSKWFN